MAQLDLRTREGALKGGLHGPAVVPGNAADSRVYLHVSGQLGPVMPMGGTLDEDQISLLRDWINQGAPWGKAAEDSQAAKKTSVLSVAKAREITDADRAWWAFQKPQKKPVPAVRDARAARNPIDGFIWQRFEEKGIKPAPAADRRTLIRRAYLDLLGLLPTPAEVEAFVSDRSPDAFNKLIERLLASPRYGERWGRHWLDVARYADSGGYEHDYDYPHAWRYRDYVIRAFNEDKPYDQFVREQVAGDELDNVTYDSVTATGFYRVGPRVGYREKDNPQYRYSYLDDMIATTSRGFMGLSVDCARCHDHKFDPIGQLDYYRMMAVLFPFVNYEHPLAPPDQVATYNAKKAEIDSQIDPLKKRIAEIEAPYKKVAFEKILAKFPEDIQVAVRTPEAERTEGQQLLAAQILSIGGGSVKDALSEQDKTEVESLQAQIKKLAAEMPPPLPVAMGVRDGDYRFAPDGAGDEPLPGKGKRIEYGVEGTFLPEAGKPYNPPAAHFMPTADYLNLGPEVDPGFLQVIWRGNAPTALAPASGAITTGRRRALAEWLLSDEHPLTARVMANRIWQHHFEQGLVSTASNFGRMGQMPTHPELLDWLAVEFREQGWSMKQMHRLIMSSETYQMASAFYEQANAKADPENKLLWRYPQHRIEAESLRDIVLAASGTLNLEMGGKPFFPPLLESVRKSAPNGKWELTKEGPEVWRRSIYSYWKRGLRYPMFEVFDQPNPNVTCERRNVTTVPTQALTLLNNEFVLVQAKYFAGRVKETAGDDGAEQVRALYRVALSREPSTAELERNLAFLGEQSNYHRAKGAEADASLAALTDLCDVILNANEFVYIN
jgi:hypothetical protein